MGNSYILHTEARINGVWKCIDGYYMLKRYGETEEHLRLATTYESESRSYFGSTYEKLKELSKRVLFSELSKEIQDAYPDWKYDEDIYGESVEKEAYYRAVSLRTFDKYVPNTFSKHGIVHKDKISEFESGDIGELWDESEDIAELPELTKSLYQYYEWDDHDGWQIHFKQLKQRIDETVGKYFQNSWEFDFEGEIRIVIFMF